MKRNDPDYMKAYRAQFGGSTPSDKALGRTAAAAATWVRRNHPMVWSEMLAVQRGKLGLPVEVGPGGKFTKPIEHGTYGGYEAHRYRSESPCERCATAARVYRRDLYRRRLAASVSSSPTQSKD